MSHLRCFVSGCKSGYASDRKERKAEGKNCLGLFCVPRDEGMLEKWKKAIPQTKKEFRWTDSVCEKHFYEDDLERYYVAKLPDGTNQIFKRKIAKLKPKAVPAIFPNLPAYKMRKTQAQLVLGKQKEKEPSHEPTVPEEPISEECYLSECINSVNLPSHLWTIHSTSNNFVICAKWNENCLAERRVVIKDDLSITVFIQNCELEEKYEKITSVNELSLLLKEVDRYVACAGIDRFSRICQGYIPLKALRSPGKPTIWCNKCKIEWNLVSRRRVRHNFKSAASFKRKRLYHTLVCDQREYISLKEEVNDLRKKIEYEKAISLQLSKLDEI